MGFYYDDQLNNKSNTIRLYGTKDGSTYTEEPLAKAIFNEDFEFEISNSWSDLQEVILLKDYLIKLEGMLHMLII